MAKLGERIVVNQVLDTRPRIFSLPVSVIVPIMFIVSVVGCIGYIARFSGYMILFTMIVFVCVYFFLFGQESWRLTAKFTKPPRWVRSDVQAIPFMLERESHDAKRTKSRKRQPRRPLSQPN